MQIPPELIDSLKSVPGFHREAFEQVHLSGEQVTSVRINPLKSVTTIGGMDLGSQAAVPWTRYGYYLAERPSFTFDPLFHAGCYYVQEASSMLLEQALLQHVSIDQPLRVLDLCASPGGKSTHLQSLLNPKSLLVSNEVIRSRAQVLKDNIVKWGAGNVVVTNNDPKDFSRLPGFFDVIVVDAPCSGSGLFRRDPEAVAEWSLNNVQLCSQRQQRILADCWPALKEGGLLIYSTCSYSTEEDESVMNWLLHEQHAQSLAMTINPSWGVCETQTAAGATGYRCWPDQVKGEGFFISCFRKNQEATAARIKVKKQPDLAGKQETAMTAKWMDISGVTLIRHQQTVYAWPAELFAEFSYLLDNLKLLYSGIRAGELMRDKLVPDHALAMSRLVFPTVRKVDLTKEMAIRYLQRKDISLEEAGKGWAQASYQEQSLGWLNILPGRINNYYPKELRILREL